MLNREPMGMKLNGPPRWFVVSDVSVLNREPMGMKLRPGLNTIFFLDSFSAQPRADGDEAPRADRVGG